jgi:hypothetical protein
MIVDRLTLVLAYIYLDNFQSTEGTIDSVLLIKTNKFRESTKSIPNMNMDELATYINTLTPITTVTRVENECIDQCLYTLRSFSITLNNGGKRYIENREGEGWVCRDTGGINTTQFADLSRYIKKLNEIRAIYDNLYLDEYILAQKDYIECGYISQMFSSEIDQILELYKQYKTY